MLHHPDLQLDEAVSVEAVVLSHAAVADFMATKIQLAVRTQGSDFGIPDCILLQNVDQAPKKTNGSYPARIPLTYLYKVFSRNSWFQSSKM